MPYIFLITNNLFVGNLLFRGSELQVVCPGGEVPDINRDIRAGISCQNGFAFAVKQGETAFPDNSLREYFV
jgi:hypothetical protein